MRQKLFFAAAIAAISATAQTFDYQGIKYEWIVPGQTARTADAGVASMEEIVHSEWWSELKYLDKNGNQIWSFPNSNASGNIVIPEKVTDYSGTTGTVVEIGGYGFVNTNNISSITLPSTVTRLAPGAFAGMMNAKLVMTIGENVTSIGDNAFRNTYEIVDLTILGGLDSGGKDIFKNSKLIGTLTIAGNVRNIPDGMFEGKQLKNVNLGGNLESIGKSAFANCPLLEYVNYEEDMHLTTIGDGAFENCPVMREIEVPGSVRFVGDNAFKGKSDTRGWQIHISNGVEHLGAGCFKDQRVDGSFEIPSSVKEIGSKAFELNDQSRGLLRDIYCHAGYPPSLENEDVFPDWIYETVCLHVPQNSKELYEDPNNGGWYRFSCIIADLVDVTAPMSNIIGYAFVVPNDRINLETDVDGVVHTDGTKWTWGFVKDGDSDIIDLAPNGDIVAKKFGQAIAVAYRDDNNTYVDGMTQQEMTAEPTIAACVIVFVCPTVTLVYNHDNMNADMKSAPAPKSHIRSVLGADDNIGSLTNDYATYEYRVVYNSLPQFKIEPAKNIIIEKLERGQTDEDGFLKDALQEIEDAQYEDESSIVPIDPITDNRVIQVYTTMNLANLSGVESVEITDEISVSTNGHIITVHGVEPDVMVTIYNAAGQIVHKAPGNTIEIVRNGVYIVLVKDGAFKVIVR